MATTPGDEFDAFLSRLLSGGTGAGDLLGCTEDEVRRLENKYRVALPEAYRRFLRTMGHWSGRLFAHDHVDVTYADVLRMTETQRRQPAVSAAGGLFVLPYDALVILGRLGEQHLFIRCQGGQDAAVWCYGEFQDGPVESHASIIEWLDTWRREAEEAVSEAA